MRPLFLAAAFCMTAMFPAQAFLAQNHLRVEATGTTDFTVPYGGKSGPRDFWCAAGDYAQRVLHLPAATEIYRTSAPPRKSGEGMSFSLDPARATAPGLIRLSQNPGLSVAEARFQCELVQRRD